MELEGRRSGEGAEVVSVVGDVSDVDDAGRIIGAAVDSFGRVDVLVANAGVIPLNNIVDATPEDWDHVMAVDGRGMFLTCKFAIEAMLEQENPGGSIVCLSSISGLAGQAEQSTYGPAKFVASGITKHLAAEGAARGARGHARAAPRPAARVRGLPRHQAPRRRVGGPRRARERRGARHHNHRGRRRAARGV